uniref:Uncharacterized protein n=1 Tax=Rangifer tarandus platyrhynchus TaxID=3082113 RepID=A0ACB0ENA9_RANTA|nr:unnamed protein product [Rangifer tarandus platyrhynchus]
MTLGDQLLENALSWKRVNEGPLVIGCQHDLHLLKIRNGKKKKNQKAKRDLKANSSEVHSYLLAVTRRSLKAESAGSHAPGGSPGGRGFVATITHACQPTHACRPRAGTTAPRMLRGGGRRGLGGWRRPARPARAHSSALPFRGPAGRLPLPGVQAAAAGARFCGGR